MVANYDDELYDFFQVFYSLVPYSVIPSNRVLVCVRIWMVFRNFTLLEDMQPGNMQP